MLFREGTPASEGVRMFAKTGRSDKLDDGGGDEETVLDTFVAPGVATGAARTQAQFFVDGNHSRVKYLKYHREFIIFYFSSIE